MYVLQIRGLSARFLDSKRPIARNPTNAEPTILSLIHKEEVFPKQVDA